MREAQELQEHAARIDVLIQELEATSDPVTRSKVRELMECVMELHGAGLERIMEIVSESRENGAAAVRALGRDELVSSLLVLYDLHPDDFETRVERGIEKARKLVAGVELVAIDERRIRVRLAGAHGCGSAGKESAVRDIILEAAPDALEIIIESDAASSAGFVPLASLQSANGSASRV